MIDPLAQIVQSYTKAEPQGIEHYKPPRESRWLYDFCHDTLEMNDEHYPVGLQPGTHMEVCAELEDAVGDCKFEGTKQTLLHVEMPRFTYKTSIICEGLVLGAITLNPDVRILIANADHGSSKKRIIGVKYHLTKNETFTEKYGDDWKPGFQEAVWSSSQITVAKRKNGALREPTVDTAALGKDMTGSHYGLIICDDLVNDKTVETPERRAEVYDYIMSLLSLLDPGGTLIVVGTRWHPDDAYGRMIKEDQRLLKKGKQPNFKYYIRSCWDGPNGLFFPEKLTREFLDLQYQRQKARFFSANYENKPIADEDILFDMSQAQVETFDYRWNGGQSFVCHNNIHFPVDITLAWDPAGPNPTQKSDSQGITVVGTDQYDRWWVFEAQAYKGLPSDVLNYICNLVAYYRPWTLIIESAGGYGLWINLLNAELIKRGLKVGIQEDKVGTQNKATRISMLEPRWRNRGIFLKQGQDVLLDQLTNFSPNVAMVHEDVLDSLAKHYGNTIPAQERRFVMENPVDKEWLEYKKEMLSGDNDLPQAGRKSTRWMR